MTKTENREPNWDKWRLIPDAKLWQLVALSLEIDPDKVSVSPNSWMAGSKVFEETQEFRDRIDIALANSQSLEAVSLNMADPTDSKHSVARFAAWAVSVGWQIPKELREIAASPFRPGQRPLSGARPDWDTWRHILLAPLWQAVALSLDIEPQSLPGYHPQDINRAFEDCSAEFQRRLRIACNQLEAGVLPFERAVSLERYYEVRLSDFARWAVDLPLGELPDELSALAAAPAQEPAKKARTPLGLTERRSYLLVVAALCEKCGIVVSDRGAATKIAELTEKRGARVSDDVVREMLKQIPDAEESRKK